MTSTPPGWYPDPERAATVRWWDGTQWTQDRAPMAVARPAAGARKLAPTTWLWVGAASAGFLVLAIALGLGQAMVVLAILAIVVAIIALSSERIRWLRSRTWQIFTLAAGLLLLIGGAAAAAATSPQAPTALAGLPGSTTSPRLSAPTATPTPTPLVTTAEITETEAIAFERTSQDDATRDVGTTAVIQPGVDGTRTITYRVTYVDGVETDRVVTGDVVTVAPVPEVTAVGIRQPAPAPVVGGGGGGCDPNYTGACVPIARDVDCAGGSGDGPEYVSGPVRVVGSDIYDLDRDGDGIACDR